VPVENEVVIKDLNSLQSEIKHLHAWWLNQIGVNADDPYDVFSVDTTGLSPYRDSLVAFCVIRNRESEVKSKLFCVCKEEIPNLEDFYKYIESRFSKGILKAVTDLYSNNEIAYPEVLKKLDLLLFSTPMLVSANFDGFINKVISDMVYRDTIGYYNIPKFDICKFFKFLLAISMGAELPSQWQSIEDYDDYIYNNFGSFRGWSLYKIGTTLFRNNKEMTYATCSGRANLMFEIYKKICKLAA